MSINSILSTAASGLGAAQTQLRVVSDNVANVNTPGYVRKIADQTPLVSGGVGAGVDVGRVRLATDRFLQAASLQAGSDAGRQAVRYELYERISALFGDPGGDAGFFSRIDDVFSAFAATAETPTSVPRRQEAIVRAQSVFEEAARISRSIQAVREDADGRIRGGVERANALLKQIEDLNVAIGRAVVGGDDASGAETAQAGLVDELAGLMNIQTTPRAGGGLSIRSGSGVLLAGDGHATLEYDRAGAVSAETGFNSVWVVEGRGGVRRALADGLTSGELRGLIELRDVEAPAAAERLAELTTRLADQLNRAHNANTAVPAPAALTGRNVGQSIETALAGFSGRTTIALVDASGVVQSRADIVFSGATMTVNGAAATPATFLSVLNGQLGGAVASFTDGRLSLSTPAPGGVVVSDDAAAPSAKAGRGFSHYFGLNDLVSSERPALYDLGLTAGSALGFAAGQTMTLRFAGADGARLRDITVATPAGGTLADVLATLNDPVAGAGRYGRFTQDPATGEVAFAPAGGAASFAVIDDRTRQTPSSASLSEVLGLGGGVRAGRAGGFAVRADIRQDAQRLALARFGDAAPPGSSLSVGDARGAAGLADAGQAAARFGPAGGQAGASATVSRYAAELAGDIGGRAASAKTRADSATALQAEAKGRQTAAEGVNLDEELVLMTTYQQAFNASARMIQAAKDLYDVLLGMV